MTRRPSRPALPAVNGLRPIPTPVTFVPLRCPDSWLFSSQLKSSPPRSSASRTYALVNGPWLGPSQPSWPGALILRISRRSTPSSRAALSTSGSSMATICAPPGARCAERGGVFVYTGTPRKRMFSGW